MMSVLVKAVLKALVLPPTGPLIVAIAGLLCMRRSPRLGRFLAWAGVLMLLALSMPVVSLLLTQALADAPVLDPARAKDAGAIVILGGGVRRRAAEYGGDTLAILTLERVRYGARVAKQTGLPVLVSGGPLLGATAEAHLMRSALVEEFGVPVTWAEDRSRNTRENAIRSTEILSAAGVRDIVLVAHSVDMRRARAEFEAAGLGVIPAPTGIPSGVVDSPLDFIPNISAFRGSYFALYEMLANLWRWATS